MSSHTRSRMAAAAAAVVVLVGGLAACSGDSDEPESPATSAAKGDYTEDIPEPGDDLLDIGGPVVSSPGAEQEAHWRWPESYDAEMSAKSVSTEDGDVTYEIAVQTGQGGADRAKAALDEAVQEAEDIGASAELSTISVGDREFMVLTQDGEDEGGEHKSARVFIHVPDGEDTFYIVNFVAGAPLADTPQERVDELHQTVASLELEPR